MTRHVIGKGWVFCHLQRARHIPTGRKREKYLAEVLGNDLKDFKDGNSSSKIKKVKNQSNWMSSEQLRKYDKEKLNSVMKLKSFYTSDNKNAADFLDKLGD